MTNELTVGSPEWIEDRVKKGTAFDAVWKSIGMAPSVVTLCPDSFTFDIVIGAEPKALEKDPSQSAEDRVRAFLEAAVNSEKKPLGYKLGSLTVVTVKVNHPALQK